MREWENQDNNTWFGSRRPRKTNNDTDVLCEMCYVLLK